MATMVANHDRKTFRPQQSGSGRTNATAAPSDNHNLRHNNPFMDSVDSNVARFDHRRPSAHFFLNEFRKLV
jgi:hypothetical protein